MRNLKSFSLLFVVYCLLAIFLTWPMVTKISSSTYGYSGDNFGAIRYFWWWKRTKFSGLPVRDSFLEEVPFGVAVDREPGTIFYYLPVKIFTLFTNEVFAYNLVLLLSFPLAAVSMYILAFSITKSRWASLISGLIFSFSPYHLWKAYNHLDLALIWPMPLYVWALIKLEKGTVTTQALVAGFFLAANILTNFYYGYFMLLFTAAYVLVRVFQVWLVEKRLYFTRRVFTFYFLLFVSASAVVLPFTYHVLADARRPLMSLQSQLRKESYQRPLSNLISLSARPWDYLIPSQDHPIFGKFVPRLYDWIKTRSGDFKTISAPPHERTIYLGWIPILLTILTSYFLLGDHRFRGKYSSLVITILGIAGIMVLISLPPFIFFRGYTVYLPSFFLHKIFPMFRTYARLGVVVLLCTALLAGVSSAWLLCKFKLSQRSPRSWVLLVFFIGLVLFEFLNIPPSKIVDFGKTPPEYEWLAKQSGNFSILEWPESFNLADALLFQRVHKKGLANWHSQSPYYGLWDSLGDLYNLQVTDKIAALGVKYVVVHKRLIFDQPNPVDDLWYTRAVKDPERYKSIPSNMKLAADFDGATIFEVAHPNPAKMVTIIKRVGVGGPFEVQVLGGKDWSWERDGNRLYLMNLVERNNPKNLRVRVSFEVPRNLGSLLEVSFNGRAIEDPWQPLELTLLPFENNLWFRGVEKQHFEIKNITVEVLGEME